MQNKSQSVRVSRKKAGLRVFPGKRSFFPENPATLTDRAAFVGIYHAIPGCWAGRGIGFYFAWKYQHRNKKMARRNIMTPRQAIRILMLSPIYFRLDLPARKVLVDEFCALCADRANR
ncbi:MAG: hypothetical protein BM485_00555 [Desulfobulbaceae bacterium DB1]|nr:MAG: hypothetical protein BM485_00555 [Desulfobulbaceae bacterium DB1]